MLFPTSYKECLITTNLIPQCVTSSQKEMIADRTTNLVHVKKTTKQKSYTPIQIDSNNDNKLLKKNVSQNLVR